MSGSVWPKIIGKAIFLASMQAAIGSVEMSSKFSVHSFGKDQETLQRAADALYSYMIIGGIWTIGSMLVLFSSYGYSGALVGLLANLVMLGWIYFSYVAAFKSVAGKHNLKVPEVLTKRASIMLVSLMAFLTVGLMVYTVCENTA